MDELRGAFSVTAAVDGGLEQPRSLGKLVIRLEQGGSGLELGRGHSSVGSRAGSNSNGSARSSVISSSEADAGSWASSNAGRLHGVGLLVRKKRERCATLRRDSLGQLGLFGCVKIGC
ncbi:hypothetical protein PAHAL_5G195800 [Panicum hallii]|jgi:hypothetical protein|uniref:Uncharacterized protein n=1 Tax=Panicum hallii TaxID=206008 RepID=A0A2T8IKJ9_9POAL|nr:hypothetical protein PAHAL_5G195800 [Panicum hallii]